MSMHTIETVIDCPHCNRSIDAEFKASFDEKTARTNLKCDHCHGLIGVDAELSVDVWDRSADQEG